MFKTNTKKSIGPFIKESVINGNSIFLKIHVVRQAGMLSYTKFFAINTKLEVMTYLVADDGLKYNYRGHTLMFKHYVHFETITCNYNSYFKGGKVEVISIDEFKKKMPEKLNLIPYLNEDNRVK